MGLLCNFSDKAAKQVNEGTANLMKKTYLNISALKTEINYH